MSTTGKRLKSLLSDDGTLSTRLENFAWPEPADDEVLIKIQAAPINPSDLALLTAAADMSTLSSTTMDGNPGVVAKALPGALGAFKSRIGLDLIAGNEGAGTVVATGASARAKALAGHTVATFGGGMYAEYRIAKVDECIPLPQGMDAEKGASAFVNPMTSLGFVETMKREGHSAIIHTAAASNLGQMLNRICLADDIPLINIVRRSEHVELLKSQGAKTVLNSSSDTFFTELVDAIDAVNATLAFDATGGGELASTVMNAMEAAAARHLEVYNRYGSDRFKQLYIYGRLDPSLLTIRQGMGFAWSIAGWLLTHFLQKAGVETMMRMQQRVVTELETTFASNYTARISLEEMLDPGIMSKYAKMETGQKYLVMPN